MGEAPADAPRASVIVPFHRGLEGLSRVVAAVAGSAPGLEIVIVADGAVDDVAPLAAAHGARLLSLPEARGPAVARNRGAAIARGAVFVFLDADVVVAPDAVPRLLSTLEASPDVAGVFGAYDHAPADPGFFSQYRNLAHAYVHEQGRADARTFWAGLGAVRAEAFAAVGGFDERFGRPCIEDIELGYRLTAAGYRLRLDPRIRGTHLKRWTFASSVASDVRDRGVPWTQLILRNGGAANDLNVAWTGRLSVLLACGTVAALVATPAAPRAALAAAGAGAGFALVNRGLLRFLAARRGAAFAARVLPCHVVHHLCNAASLAVGVSLWAAQRAAGWRTPWTAPPDGWRGPARPSC